MYYVLTKMPMFREPQKVYERELARAKANADGAAKELLVAEVYEYDLPDASDARRVYLAVPDRLHLLWSMNGQRVAVVENSTEQFVQVGGEVVKVLIAPKPRSAAQKKQDFLAELERKCRRACPPLVSKTEQDRMYQDWARGYADRVQRLNAQHVVVRASSVASLRMRQV